MTKSLKILFDNSRRKGWKSLVAYGDDGNYSNIDNSAKADSKIKQEILCKMQSADECQTLLEIM